MPFMPMPRATTSCLAANSRKNARPLSAPVAAFSATASRSSVTTQPGTLPALNARATGADRM